MQPKLGELLLEQGLVTREQLQEALSAQVVHAGRLGSNLVELGYVPLEAVADALSRQLGAPVPSQQELGNIPRDLLRIISVEIADRFKIMPFRMENRTLHLAMLDPRRADLIARLGHALALQIHPYVVPQLRLLYFLEHYYRIPRPKRFLRSDRNAAPHPNRRNLEATIDPSRGIVRPPPPPIPMMDPEIQAEEVKSDSLELVFLDQVPRTPTTVAPAILMQDETFDFDVDLSFDDDMPTDGNEALDQVLEQLDEAQTREAVVHGIVHPVLPGTTVSLLLLPRGELALGLGAWGTELSPAQVRSLVIPLSGDSLVRTAFEKCIATSGPAADDALQSMIATYLQAEAPIGAAVVPIMHGKRVLNLLCVQRSSPIDDDALHQLGRVAARGAEAYRRLIRQQQDQ